MRYDAYNEQSGQQSLSIALLDDTRSGIVLSCIHHREQARVYAKQVRAGEAELALSPEEEEAVRLARRRRLLDGAAAPRELTTRDRLSRARAAPSARRRCSTRCAPERVEAVALETLYDVVMAVRDGEVQWALAPIENSIEGPVTVTLDTLATEAPQVAIVGELVRTVHHCLIASRGGRARGDHDRALAPAGRGPVRALPARGASGRHGSRAATSTAEAVRLVAEHASADWAAIGTRLAAEVYGCVVLRERIEDHPDNETRFVWLGRADADPAALPLREPPSADAARQDLARLLGPRRRARRLARRLPRRVREPRDQPHEDRVAPAPRAARPLHVLRRPRGWAHERGRRGGARGPALRTARRCACSAPTRAA